jgi:hypothetical protein
VRKVLEEAVAGLMISFAAFAVAYFLRFFVPGAEQYVYFSRIGELIAGAMIFTCALGLALVARFIRMALFVSAAVAGGIEMAMLLAWGDGFPWEGWLGDLWSVARHTIVPLTLAGLVFTAIRQIGVQREEP